MARPTRSSNSAWSSRPSAKCSASRSVTVWRSASETRRCWSEYMPRNSGAKPRGVVRGADMVLPPLEGLDDGAGDGLVTALFGDQQQAGQVERDARAADDGQDHEGDPDEGRVDAEVAGQARGDARQHAVLVGPAQGRALRSPAGRRLGARV